MQLAWLLLLAAADPAARGLDDADLPHVLDEFEGGAAFLAAHRVAEQTAEQTNIVPQRTVWLVLEVHG